MRVGVAQIDCLPGEVAQNTKKLIEFIERSAKLGCELIVLPEMSDTGYLMSAIVETASEWDSGPVEQLQETALTWGIHVVAGVSERVENDIFNTIISIDPAGEIKSKYRKTHLITVEPMLEHHYLKSGDRLVLSQVGDARVGFMTCYDVRFPEVARTLALGGAQIILLPSAFPLLRVGHWKVLTETRAIENQLYLITANRIGTDGPGLTFCGNSRVIDPYGTVVAAASEIEETLLVAEIDLAKVELIRENMQIMQDRRPELYAQEMENSP